MPEFWEKICDYAIKCREDRYIKIEEIGSKNIGLLNVRWFIENKTELFSYFVNYDKSLIMKYKNAEFPNKDFIYSKFTDLPRWLNEDSLFLFASQGNIPLGKCFYNPNKHMYLEKNIAKKPDWPQYIKNPVL